jgi:hypothetical protein
MVTGCREALGETGEDISIAVADGRSFAVHEMVGPHNVSAELLRDGLVSQAYAKEGHLAGEFGDHSE